MSSELFAQQGFDRMAAYRKPYPEKIGKTKEIRNKNHLILKQIENVAFSMTELYPKEEEFQLAIELARKKNVQVIDLYEGIERQFEMFEAKKIDLKQIDIQVGMQLKLQGIQDNSIGEVPDRINKNLVVLKVQARIKVSVKSP